ncbi:MAG: cytochrome c, partial [Candidatus Thioglobus sp.]|nr:cytochrome c [Candidatus Thioglobus sp.]
LERTYDEWKYSAYAQNNIQCQDCHMVPVETAIRVADEMKPARELANHGLGGKAAIGAESERDLIHGHAFVGGNSVITAQLGDADSYEKSLIAKKRLRSAAELEISINKIKNQGDLHNLTVKVTNQRAGHHMPTSLTFIRELWLQVEVTDQNNRLIFESGGIDEQNEVDENATMFKAYAVDENGAPAQYIWTVARFERRTTIAPKGHQFGRYNFNVPAGTTELRVRARLNYRSFSQHFVDHLLGEGKLEVPKVVMNDLKIIYQAADLSVKSEVNFSEIDEVEAEGNRLLEAYLSPKIAIQEQKRLIQACSVCHGKNGISTQDEFPNLAGQNEIYLLSALRAYKSGGRIEPRMNAMIKDVSDKQLRALAEHYAKISK